MDFEDAAQQILNEAFVEELQKLAGLPQAVLKGRGGAYGAARLRAHKQGRASAVDNAVHDQAGLEHLRHSNAANRAQDSATFQRHWQAEKAANREFLLAGARADASESAGRQAASAARKHLQRAEKTRQSPSSTSARLRATDEAASGMKKQASIVDAARRLLAKRKTWPSRKGIEGAPPPQRDFHGGKGQKAVRAKSQPMSPEREREIVRAARKLRGRSPVRAPKSRRID